MPKHFEIIFVGTGGGGGMVATQKLATAGTYLEADGLKIYIDPGPGAVLRARQLGIKLEELDAILLTHRHLDHAHDIVPMLEAWLDLDNPKNIGEKKLYLPTDYLDEYQLQEFSRKKIKEIIILSSQTRYKLKNLTITTSKALIEKPHHINNLPQVFAFHIQGEKIDIGFWSQSRYVKGITDGFKPKILIFDFINDSEPYLSEQANIIKNINPELVILRHFILPMYDKQVSKLADLMQGLTNIKTIIAPEGGNLGL